MPSGDARKDFVVATTGNYFGIQSSDSVLNEVYSSKELNIFLDDGNSPVLAAKYDAHQGKKSINLSSHVEPSDTAEKVLVFFKLQPEAITPDNLHQNVFVSSMLSSPVNTLYHSVQKVFAPLLLKDEKWSRNFDPKLQSLLSELEAGLGSVVRKQDSSSSRAANVGDEDNVGGILTPQDEFQYWSDASVSGYDLSERERASYFQESFQKGERLHTNKLHACSCLLMSSSIATNEENKFPLRNAKRKHYFQSVILIIFFIRDMEITFFFLEIGSVAEATSLIQNIFHKCTCTV